MTRGYPAPLLIAVLSFYLFDNLVDILGGTAPARVSAAVMRAYGELWAARLRGEW